MAHSEHTKQTIEHSCHGEHNLNLARHGGQDPLARYIVTLVN